MMINNCKIIFAIEEKVKKYNHINKPDIIRQIKKVNKVNNN